MLSVPSKFSPGQADTTKAKRAFYDDDKVFIKTGEGTQRAVIKGATLDKMRWYYKLQIEGQSAMYENGAWVAQGKLTLAAKGPRD